MIKTAKTALFSATARMRLEHEAHVLSQIKDERFTPLLEYGSSDECVFLVMPFIPGVTLQERLRQGPLDVRDAITLGRALAAALGVAHSRGVLHRDVKPANVIVDGSAPLRKATLIDFGLARSTNLDAVIREQWVGTAQYLSPEGAGLLDQEVTACSDLYSLGIVLFECLLGRPPFPGQQRRRGVAPAHDGPARRAAGPGAGGAARAGRGHPALLRKDPRDRYQSAEAVAADLDVIAEALGAGRVGAGPGRWVARPAPHADRAGVRRPGTGAGGAGGSAGTRRRRDKAGWCCWRPNRAAARPACWPSSPCAARNRGRGCCAARASTRPPSAPSSC